MFPQDHHVPFALLNPVLQLGLDDPQSFDALGNYLDAADIGLVPENEDLYRAAFKRAKQLVKQYRGDFGYKDIVNRYRILDDILQDILDGEARLKTERRFTRLGARTTPKAKLRVISRPGTGAICQ